MFYKTLNLKSRRTVSGERAARDDGAKRTFILHGTRFCRQDPADGRLVIRVVHLRQAREISLRTGHDALPARDAEFRKPIRCRNADFRETRINEIAESLSCGNRGPVRHPHKIRQRRARNPDPPASQRCVPHSRRDFRFKHAAVGQTANCAVADAGAKIIFKCI